MRRLLLHIGYPKTATTTLQEEVFLGLHNSGIINYLGRTTKSTHTRSGKSSFQGNDIVPNLRRHFVLNEKLSFLTNYLDKEKLNVISDEDLTFHGFFQKAQFGVEVNPLDYPVKLNEILGDDVEVELLVTIRNQPDLIFSCFAQKYRFVRKNIGKMSFKEFIENKPDSFFDIFRFHTTTSLYAQTFNSEVNILLFEDLIRDQETFWNRLSQVLSTTGDELKIFAGKKHYRQKEKSKGYLKTGFSKLSKPGKIVAPLFGGNKNFMLLLDKRYYMRFSLLQNLEKKLLLKSVPDKIDLPDAQDKARLKARFQKDNLKLVQNFNLDIEKLKDYNYLD